MHTSTGTVILVGWAIVVQLLPTVPASAAEAVCEGRAATHIGTEGDDVLVGTDGDDVMVGLGGDDIVSGLLGNDVICGDAGSDRLAGMAGDDRILGGRDSDAGGDGIWPGTGSDHVDAGLDPLTLEDYSVPADTIRYEDLLEAGPASGQADLHGEDGADEIVVAATEDVDVEGGAGRNSMVLGLAPRSRGISLDGGSSNDLALLHVRNAGFPQGSTITVDLARRVLLAGPWHPPQRERPAARRARPGSPDGQRARRRRRHAWPRRPGHGWWP